MRKFVGVSAVVGLVAAQTSTVASAQSQVSSATISFANVDNQCVDVGRKAVTLWLTSEMVQEHNGWLSQTNGVGAEADVTLTSATKGAQTFPRARQVSTNGLSHTNLVRAELSFPILVQYDFSKDSTINQIDIPVVLLSTRGDSQIATYAKALIKVTQAVSASIPSNPFAQGVDMGGKLANAFFSNIPSKDVEKNALPSFEISRSLSRSTSCTPNDLKDGAQAIVSDVSGSSVPDTINVGQRNLYCFYKMNDASDPDIGYTLRPANGVCPSVMPAGTRQLQNPHIIYIAYGVAPLVASPVIGAKAIGVLGGPEGSGLSIDPVRVSDIMRAQSICASVRIPQNQCIQPR